MAALQAALPAEAPPAMPEMIHAPDDFTRQVSGKDPNGRDILAVLTKRSYRYDSRGACTRHEEPSPIREVFKADDESGELLQESDIYPIKLATDVILHGQASRGEPATTLQCGLRIGPYEKRIMVTGNRRCGLSHTGELLFSDAQPFTTMSLSYRNAYGGRDKAGHIAVGNPLAELAKYVKPNYDLSDFSLCDYPRNPAGKGYLCHWDPASLDKLELPNLEDPLDRLSPTRLFAGQWDRWPAMPLPQSTGWVSHAWFPRMAYLGIAPKHDPAYANAAEIARGYAPADIMERKSRPASFHFRMLQGASLGLQFPYLHGNESIELINIAPDIRSVIQLPGERPVIYVDGRKGKMLETAPVLHTVRIEPFFKRVSLVWRGHGPAIRPYMTEELKTMPLHVRWP